MGQYLSCDYFEVDSLQFISTYEHQDFFVIAVEPFGQYAIGLATEFAFKYTPYQPIVTYAASAVWPNNATFDPRAADASQTFTVVAGFLEASIHIPNSCYTYCLLIIEYKSYRLINVELYPN